MNARLLLSTVAVICLVLPGAGFADPPGDRGGGGDHKGEQRQGQRAQKAERAKAQHPQQAPQGGGPKDRGSAQSAQPAQKPSAAQPRQARPDHQPNQRQAAQPSGRARAAAPPSAPRGPAAASLGAWHAPAKGPDRDRANQQWRRQNSGWDRGAVWRRSPTWWRGDPGFSLFVGPRIGFFFVPDLGYRAMPTLYRDRHWRPGDYLPGMFRRYVVVDYRRYGLPQPPFGCVWIWLNGDVALIDRGDGYILDVVTNVW